MHEDTLFANARVRLSVLSPADAPTVARWYDDTAAQRLYDAAPARPRSAAELENWLANQSITTNVLFGIRRRTDDALIGMVELDGILWAHRVSGLSILIGEASGRGKGYGHAAMQLVLRYAFHELNLWRVQLTVFSYNAPAIALYERLGFQREGSFRAFLERDGQRYDMLLYGLLRPEWEEGVRIKDGR